MSYWDSLRKSANELNKALQLKPDHEKMAINQNDVCSILNGYREGDVSFNDAVDFIAKIREAAQGIAKSSAQQTQAGSPAGSPKPCACNNSLCQKNKGTHVVDGYCKENLFNCGLRTASSC